MNEHFLYEWQQMDQTAQRIAEELKALTQDLAQPSNNPEIKALLLQRELIKKESQNLEREVYVRKAFIRHLQSMLEKTKHCLGKQVYDPAIAKTLEKDFRARIRELKRLNAKEGAVQAYRRIYDNFAKPRFSPGELEACITKERKIVEADIATLEQALNAGNQTVQSINAIIQARLQQTKNAATSAELAAKRQKEKMISWICQDREHAQWVAENIPNYKHEALKLLEPQKAAETTVLVEPICHPPKIRHRVKHSKIPEEKSRPWRFFLVGQTDALPQEADAFAQVIEREVITRRLPRFKFDSLYNWLTAITCHMTIGERQKELNKFRGGFYDGWKHLAIGDCIVLLNINEPEQKIIIALETREIFQKIWRQS